MLSNTYHNIQNSAIKEAVSIGNIKSYFVKVTDVDDSPDMTDIHPRDREDMDLRFMTLNKIMFPKTLALIQQDANITDANIIAFAPQTQLYEHVDTIELEPYAEIDWLSVYMGMFVPSFDPTKVGVKVGDTVYDHKETIIFDTQIPHSAWNWTDDWWVSVRLNVRKTAF
jgi:hypothetical protein|tara:strand:- start:947 stop:1453 length:507 start_codon:yes stop_codon:yes gene_type:complete